MAARRRKQSERNILFIGITGGMGCGQSTVARQFEAKGCLVLDADKIAHKILEKDADVKRELGKAFGKSIFYRNRKINRKVLGEVAFKSPEKTHQLNKIVHPRLVEAVVNEVARARESKKHRVVCLDAALIYEMQMEKMFDHIVVVASRMKQRIARIKERDGLEEVLIKERMANQIPIEEKSKWGDFVIHNNGTLEQLEAKALKVYEELTGKKAKTTARKPRRQSAGKTEGAGQSKPASTRSRQTRPKPDKPVPTDSVQGSDKPDKPKRSKRKPQAKREENTQDVKPAEDSKAVREDSETPAEKPKKPASGEAEDKPKPRARRGRRPRRVGPRSSKPPTEGS